MKMKEVQVLDEHFGIKVARLTFWQRILLRLLGHVYLFHAQKEGWKGSLPFYLVKCRQHGILYLDYPHGYRNYFSCPLCRKEWYDEK